MDICCFVLTVNYFWCWLEHLYVKRSLQKQVIYSYIQVYIPFFGKILFSLLLIHLLSTSHWIFNICHLDAVVVAASAITITITIITIITVAERIQAAALLVWKVSVCVVIRNWRRSNCVSCNSSNNSSSFCANKVSSQCRLWYAVRRMA